MRLQSGKFGGPRRQVHNQIEKLRSIKPLHADNVEDFEKFSDALENIVVLLQTQGKLNELQLNSSLYTMSLEKIPEESTSETMVDSPSNHLTFLAALAQVVATKPKRTIAVERREKRFESGRCAWCFPYPVTSQEPTGRLAESPKVRKEGTIMFELLKSKLGRTHSYVPLTIRSLSI